MLPGPEIGEIMASKKLEEKILPPDPARLVMEILGIIPSVEHATPLPPIFERIHTEVNKFVEDKLPRLEQMAEFEKRLFGQYP